MSPKNVRRILFGLSALACVSLFLLFGLKYLIQQPPEFYSTMLREESQTDSKSIQERSESLIEDTIQLRNDLANDPEWSFRMTESSANSWLIEHGLTSLVNDFPSEISNLRIHFEMETIQIAFQWDGKPLQSVVSLAIRPECVSPNVMEIGIVDVRAGVLPVAWRRFQEIILSSVRSSGLDAEWKNVDSIPTLKIQVNPKLENRDIAIEKITTIDKEIRISGKSSRSKRNQ